MSEEEEKEEEEMECNGGNRVGDSLFIRDGVLDMLWNIFPSTVRERPFPNERYYHQQQAAKQRSMNLFK